MRSPEAARALPELVALGVLTPERAAPLLASARGEIVSVRGELRALLGLGVTLLTAGVGLFLKEHHEDLGPTTIAVVLFLFAAAAFALLVRRAPPFSWNRAADADWIVDGLLLLAVALTGAELGWIEWQFTPLGQAWPWHLLLMSVVTALLAARFDSIPAWSLALTTFAAWRGVSLTLAAGRLESQLFESRQALLRENILLCAAVFALLGWAARKADRKTHFEPSSTLLAALAAGIAFASGIGEPGDWPLWTFALAALGAGVARFAFLRRRLGLFALGALALYVAVTRFLVELLDFASAGALGCLWFAGSTVGAIALLYGVHKRFQAMESADRPSSSRPESAPGARPEPGAESGAAPGAEAPPEPLTPIAPPEDSPS